MDSIDSVSHHRCRYYTDWYNSGDCDRNLRCQLALELQVPESFARRWKLRTMLVLVSVLIVLLVFVPGILFKSTSYWTDEIMPFSVDSVGSLLSVVALQNGRWLANNSTQVKYAYALLMTLSMAGLFLRWNDFLGRVSAGLALVFPALMIAC